MGVGGVENLQSPGLLAPRQAAFARRKIVRRSREKSSINPPRAAPAARLDPADGAPNVAAMLNTRMRMLAAGVALAGGCLAFGAKLVLVHACGSDVPYMDQWDAVGNALLQMTDVVNRRKIRHAHMVNINPQIMVEGMRADFQRVDRLSQKVVEMVRRASKIRAKTAAGTDLSADLNPDYKWLETSGIISPEKWGNLPGGE